MSGVFDLDAMAAEAEGREPFRFMFGGVEYELSPDLDFRVVAQLNKGLIYEGLARLLGAEQWERMQASDQLLTEDMLAKLFEAYQAHTGTSLGELSASTSSSVSTVRPSKRTSNGSTPRR